MRASLRASFASAAAGARAPSSFRRARDAPLRLLRPTVTIELTDEREKVGAAAAKRTAEKLAKYDQNWTLHNGVKLVVATIESSGRWSPDLVDYLKAYIKAAHPDDTKLFVYKLKAAAQRISVALQRSTALAILEMNRRATAYPSLKI